MQRILCLQFHFNSSLDVLIYTSLPSLPVADLFSLHRAAFHINTCPFVLLLPEDEDEKHEQHAEGGHVVHSLHQYHQLPPQGRHEPHKLNDPQQSEGPQH